MYSQEIENIFSAYIAVNSIPSAHEDSEGEDRTIYLSDSKRGIWMTKHQLIESAAFCAFEMGYRGQPENDDVRNLIFIKVARELGLEIEEDSTEEAQEAQRQYLRGKDAKAKQEQSRKT